MRKIICITVSVVIVAFCLLSCSVSDFDRIVDVIIPSHPWEAVCGKKLWYTLKWTYGEEIRCLYVSSEDRKINIRVPSGETVLIAAYPLGDMCPFGGALTPLDMSGTVVLSQNDGVIVNELLSIDRDVTERFNYGLFSQIMREKTDDFRKTEKISFLRDLQNGELTEHSLKVVSLFGVDPFALPNGIWISEYARDSALFVTDGLSSQLQMPEGVFRYLNADMDRVLVLIVDSLGNSFTYLRQSML